MNAKRNVTLKAHVTTEQARRIKRLAKQSGKTISTFLCLSALNTEKEPLPDAELLKALYSELARCGNNTNQIAKRWNQGYPGMEGITTEALAALSSAANKVGAALDSVLRP